MRIQQGTIGDFLGLNLEDSPDIADPRYAEEATNVMIVSGKLEARCGRVEISESQINIKPVLGGQIFFPAGTGSRRMVLVRPDGIFVRTEV